MSAEQLADSVAVAVAISGLLAPLIVLVVFGWFLRFFRSRAV